MQEPTSGPAPHDDHLPSDDRPAKHGSTFFDAARRRLEARTPNGPRPVHRLPADAVMDLPPLARPTEHYLSGRDARAHSLTAMRQQLRVVATLLVQSGFDEADTDTDVSVFPWHRVTVAHATAFMVLASLRYPNANTLNSRVAALRGVVQSSCATGLIGVVERDEVVDVLKTRKPRPTLKGHELSDDEILRLYAAAGAHERPDLAARNLLVVAIFLSTGVRCSELCSFDLGDYDRSDKSLRVLKSKNGRPHRVWLTDPAADLLEAWLEHRGTGPGPLFPSTSGGHVAPRQMAQTVKSVALRAGVDIATHDFRRTLITRLLRNGVDPFAVARIAGHESVTSTMVYDRRTEQEDRAFVDKLHLPAPQRSDVRRNEHGA